MPGGRDRGQNDYRRSPDHCASDCRQIGLKNHEAAITGRELEKIAGRGVAGCREEHGRVCRVAPEQKLRLVSALQALGTSSR
jgi:magnesium-transporting ATPase (P-type)